MINEKEEIVTSWNLMPLSHTKYQTVEKYIPLRHSTDRELATPKFSDLHLCLMYCFISALILLSTGGVPRYKFPRLLPHARRICCSI